MNLGLLDLPAPLYGGIDRALSAVLPNGTTTTWTYDPRNRLTKVEHRKTVDGTVVALYTYL